MELSAAKEMTDAVTDTPLPSAEYVVERTVGTMDGSLRMAVDAVAPNLDALAATAITQVVAVVVLIAGAHLLSWLAGRLERSIIRRVQQGKATHRFVSSLAANVLKPMSIALPWLGYLVGSMRFLKGLDYIHHFCVTHRRLLAPWVDVLFHQVINVTEPVSSFLSRLIVAVLVASLSWTLLLVKDELFSTAVTNLSRNLEKEEAQDMQRVMVPFNSLGTWLIVAGAVLTCSMLFGFNPQPLLAVGSVSGIIIGFASQEILLNLFSGITMFLTRPFVVGDLVEVRAQMTWLSKATVVKIRPLRSIFLTEDNQIMTLPNRMIMDAIVVNHNQSFAAAYVSEDLAVSRQRMFRTEFELDKPDDAAMYGKHAQDVIKAILVRLSIMQGLRKESINGYISDYQNGKFKICITAIGDSSPELSHESLQQNFLLNCYNGRFAGAHVATAS